ncbi:MAG: hypothetical protein P8R45_08630, partial [Candidatus Binatia bacterium]|nr:hypothetical protein [Candidatus Binatia bacterium]
MEIYKESEGLGNRWSSKRAGASILRVLFASGGMILGSAIAAIATSGQLDTSYSSDGIAVAPAPPSGIVAGDQEGRGIAAQANELLGMIVFGRNRQYEVLAWSTSTDGSKGLFEGDAGVGDGLGILTDQFCPSQWSDGLLHPESVSGWNSYVAAGNRSTFGDMGCSGFRKFTVSRLDSVGNVHSEFRQSIEGHEAEAFAVGLHSDGDVVATGRTLGVPNRLVTVRVNSDMTADTGFGGGDGVVTFAIGSGSAAGHNVAVEDSG